mgnify:CR=1 FL=1
MLCDLGRYEEAIREFQAAINLNGNIPDLHLRLGLNYLNLGISDQAVAEFTRRPVEEIRAFAG